MTTDLRKLFLIDAIGAATSALCLGVIMPMLPHLFGVPMGVLYSLAAMACILFSFSFFNALFPQANQKGLLRKVAIANVLYCCITAGLLVIYFSDFTMLARIYFLIEIGLIILVVALELRSLRSADAK